MTRVDKDFRDRVYDVVNQIPTGRLMTYGQVAAVCGAPWAAWEVGQIAHYGPSKLPWQRVVNKQGGLANGYPGGFEGHRADLEKEGVKVSDDNKVDVNKLLWWPPGTSLS
jgi:methylated-DNA-protein-cysteine methyltransferase related protein